MSCWEDWEAEEDLKAKGQRDPPLASLYLPSFPLPSPPLPSHPILLPVLDAIRTLIILWLQLLAFPNLSTFPFLISLY